MRRRRSARSRSCKLLDRPFEEVWNGYGSEGDIMDTLKAGHLAGLTTQQIEDLMDEAVTAARQEVARPEVWRAILALADRLKPGRMNGRTAGAIISRAINGP